LRYALISDIHSNIQALEAVLGVVKCLGVDKTLCLGDVVGYGAKPGECISLVRESCDLVLLGNHDAAAVGKSSTDYFNYMARSAIEWTRGVLSVEEIAYLENLPLQKSLDNMALTHATFSEPEKWGYIFSPLDAANEFDSNKAPLLFFGHTHYPVIFVSLEDSVNRQHEIAFSLEKGRRHMINVGSVGQPRDGNPASCFLLYDDDSQKIEYHRVPYDINGAKQDIRDAELPQELAERLSRGR
jgi:diadenosine tetraphosphatase ApaH/serine/threonine PP2A family protein phosphatase